MKPVRTLKKKRHNKRKGRKTRVCRKHRKLQRFYSILEKRRQMMTSYTGGYRRELFGGLFGIPNVFSKANKTEIAKADETIDKAEIAKKENVAAIRNLQKKTGPNDNSNPSDNQFTDKDRQELVAHKDLTSELDRNQEEAKLNKAMMYQDKYHVASSAAQASGQVAIAATVAQVAIGALTASGVAIPAAAGIAVCLILVSKLMKKYKEMQELNILLLDMNTILTNCYYLENMINKILTVFQIYINDFTDDKKYYRKIITVDEYYTNLNNARSCKNIAILVKENTETKKEGETEKTVAKPKPREFLEKTKGLKGYNLGERIQNAKQLYIESRNIDEVILAEKTEYEAFGTVIDVETNYVNIDDEDAMESLLKFVVYKRIEAGFNLCNNKDDTKPVISPDEINLDVNDILNQKGGKFYDTESKVIYKIGVNPDIKFRIKQKLDIIRDLLIEIDPSSAQDSMNSVELNESIDKIETKAFEKLENKKKLYKEWINYSIPSNCFRSSKCLNYTRMNLNLNLNTIEKDNESDLDTFLQKTNINDSSTKDTTLNKILTYWFGIKQQLNNIEKDKEVWKKYLKIHKAEWTNFLKKCFLKAEFYKSGRKVQEKDGPKPYANYEDWVRAFLRAETEKAKGRGIVSWFSQKGTDVKKFLGAANKTTLLMNTLNTLNALFIIINSQFEMSLKYYERALKFDYTSSASGFTSVSDILELIGYSSRNDKTNKQTGIDGIWDVCESSVSYQKFLLPPDFNEDKKAIMDQVDVADFTSDNSGGDKDNKEGVNATTANPLNNE